MNQTPEVSGNPIEKMSRWLDQAEDALDGYAELATFFAPLMIDAARRS